MLHSFNMVLVFCVMASAFLTPLAQSSLRRIPATDSYRKEVPVVYYPAKYVLPENAVAAGVEPPMEVASKQNMDPEIEKTGIDFEGIWWMSDNPVPEELVSFANAKVVLTDGSFPATIMVPNSRKGMWSWLTSPVGTILRKYYGTADPDAHTDFVFQSAVKGHITTGLTDVPGVWVKEFPFFKYSLTCDTTYGKQLCDPTDCAPADYDGTCADLIQKYPDDMWSRPTTFQKGSLFSDTTYTLKRIVMGNGSAHPVFWDEFMKHTKSEDREVCEGWWPFRTCKTISGFPGEKQLQSYMSDDWCARRHAAIWGLGWFGCD